MATKPTKCELTGLTGQDGNAFAIMGRVSRALRQAGKGDLVDEYLGKATSGDYNHLLAESMAVLDKAEIEWS